MHESDSWQCDTSSGLLHWMRLPTHSLGNRYRTHHWYHPWPPLQWAQPASHRVCLLWPRSQTHDLHRGEQWTAVLYTYTSKNTWVCNWTARYHACSTQRTEVVGCVWWISWSYSLISCVPLFTVTMVSACVCVCVGGGGCMCVWYRDREIIGCL